MKYLEKLREYALSKPSAVAIVDYNGVRSTTYGDLDALSDKVVTKLAELGVKPGDHVTVLMPRCMEFVAAEIGVLKYGCSIVPLIPDYPEERIQYIRNDCSASMIVELSFFDDIDQYERGETVPMKETDHAMLIYTSGSTGKPKGVVYTVRDFDFAGANSQQLFNGIGEIVFGSTAPMSFVAKMVEFVATLMAGGCVHIIAEDTRRDITALARYAEKHSLTTMFLSPRMLFIYKNSDKALRRVFTASERVVNIFSEEYEVMVLYGQSEALPLTKFMVDKPYENTPVGVALDNVEVMICDEAGSLLPAGTEGEICAKGKFPHMYLNHEEESLQHFTVTEDGETIVHTGDLGVMDERGVVTFINRKDWMVKINGQRVEPGEIEETIRKMPGIKAAAVKDITSKNGHVYLCAYYVADEGVTRESLRAWLQRSLPEYMIPAAYMKMDALPLNDHGKLDRKALPVPESNQKSARKIRKPVTDAEKFLVAQTQKILQCGEVGIDDDFLALGGDSIQATQLAQAVSEAQYGAIAALDVYAHPVICELAKVISQKRIGTEDLFCYTEGRRKPRTPLFFAHSANTGSEAYRMLAEELDPDISFYSFENHNLNYRDIPVISVEKIAKLYIYFMKSVQPVGPYRLGGWSYGGSVAFEMALQLEAAGEVIEDLTLLDPILVEPHNSHLVKRQGCDPNVKKYFETEECFEGIRSSNGVDSLVTNNIRVIEDLANYTPSGKVRTHINFFRTEEVRDTDLAKSLAHHLPANGFAQYAEDITVMEMPCDHDQIVTTRSIVRRIAQVVNAAQF
ncbi:MAG: AMP-binding protein [Bacteroidales bacterium]|nr:AMP-binding protein [Bacteroidales bacterium]